MLQEQGEEREEPGALEDEDDGAPPEPPRPDRIESNVAFVCGSGHNGADGEVF